MTGAQHHFKTPDFITLYGGTLAIWHRPKTRALKSMAATGLSAVVTLMTEHEGAQQIGRAAAAAGLEWIWIPLHGANPPPPSSRNQFVEHMGHIATILHDGGHVLIHCSAGIHRTGMFTYGLLRFLGLDREHARDTLEQLRALTAQGVGDYRMAWGDQLVDL